MKTLNTITMLSLLFLLAACGGGGGGGESTPSTGTGGVDTTAPTVISKIPASGSSSNAVNTSISVTFSEKLNQITINNTTFTVNTGASNVNGTITFDASGTTAIFSPSSPLIYGNVYSVTLKGSIKDIAGNPVSYDTTWNFSTAASNAPFVTKTFPENNTTGICLNESPYVYFNRNISIATLNINTYLFNDGTSNIPGTITAYDSGLEAWFRPSSSLQRFTTYTGKLTTGVTDLGGNPMATDYTWNFKTSWAVQMGSDRKDESHAITTDSAGNVYMAGYSKGDFDGNINTVATWADLAVVKFDAQGVKQWSRQFGSIWDDEANAIAVDASGNVYVAGKTSAGMDGNTNVAPGSSDMFIVKYDSAGNRLWTIQKGTVNPDIANSIAIDPSGYLYVVGVSASGLNGVLSATDDNNDFFISKYTLDGAHIWTKLYGTTGVEEAKGIALDSAGNLYVGGYTDGPLPGNTSVGLNDYFVGKYDKDGNQLWLKQAGTTVNDVGQGIAVDGTGNSYVVGYTDGALNGSNQGSHDIFIAKYDTAGNIQWTRQMGTSGDEEVRGVAVGPDSNIYITGYSGSNATVGLDGNSSSGGLEAFVAKYDVSGQKQWTRLFGFHGHTEGWGIAVDLDNNIYATGFAGQYETGLAKGFCGNPFMGDIDMLSVRYNSAGEMQ